MRDTPYIAYPISVDYYQRCTISGTLSIVFVREPFEPKIRFVKEISYQSTMSITLSHPNPIYDRKDSQHTKTLTSSTKHYSIFTFLHFKIYFLCR